MSLYSCQHVGAINKSETEKTGEGLAMAAGTTPAEFKKKDGSFLIISAAALASETTKILSEQFWQLQKQDNDCDSSYSSSSSSSSAPLSLSSEACSYLKQVFIVKCSSCDKSVGLLLDGKYHCLNEKLISKEKRNGWKKVERDSDKLTLFLLSQIIYREYEVPDEDELQVEYALPCSTDISKLLWINGNAAGFYSLKPEGTLDLEMMECYSMTVLDTLFIRESFRRKGYALSAIEDVIKQYPNENIGLSQPISNPMIKVLKKHLNAHPGDRMKLWEITGCGSEGNRQILWYALKR